MEKGLNPLTDAVLDTMSVTEPYAKLKDIMASLKAGSRRRVPFSINATLYAAGGSVYVISPIKGDVVELGAVVNTLTAGANATSVKIATVTVVGLSLVIPDGSAVGTTFKDRITPVPTSAVDQDQAVEIVFDATPTAGQVDGYIEIEPR